MPGTHTHTRARALQAGRGGRPALPRSRHSSPARSPRSAHFETAESPIAGDLPLPSAAAGLPAINTGLPRESAPVPGRGQNGDEMPRAPTLGFAGIGKSHSHAAPDPDFKFAQAHETNSKVMADLVKQQAAASGANGTGARSHKPFDIAHLSGTELVVLVLGIVRRDLTSAFDTPRFGG